MYTTPKPRPQFNNPNNVGLEFDQKPASMNSSNSVKSSSAVTTPSSSTSKSSSTPSISCLMDAHSSFGVDGSYFDEITNMIENSNIETPHAVRLNSSQIMNINKGNNTIIAGTGSNNETKIVSSKGLNIMKDCISSNCHTSTNIGSNPNNSIIGGGMINIFSSPKSFVCTLSSTRSTSASYTPTIADECSPQCNLPAPPNSDPFAITAFGSESRSRDAINSDFSAPLLNYLNDGLSSESWGGFLPYSKLIDYCFDGTPNNVNKWVASKPNLTPNNGVAGNKGNSAASKANELVEELIKEFIKDNGPNGAFEYVSEILNMAISNLGSRYNKDIPPQNTLSFGNWSPNTLGVGGPNFAAPTMLAHPDEFKNPSSFLKIYGDPLCGKSNSVNNHGNLSNNNQIPNSGLISNQINGLDSTHSSNNVVLSHVHSNNGVANATSSTFTNVNPMKGQNGNWACCKCSNVNFPRRFRCFKCGEYRDEAGDRIVAEYAKHVYLHHLKAYKSLNNCNTNNINGNNGNNSGNNLSFNFGATTNYNSTSVHSACLNSTNNRSPSSNIGSNINNYSETGMQPVFIQRNNNGFITASSLNTNDDNSLNGNLNNKQVTNISALT